MTTESIGKYTIVKGRGQWLISHLTKPGTTQVFGNGHFLDTLYAVPDWEMDALEEAFKYKGETYFVSEFMCCDKHMPIWMRKFDGYKSDSFFSGILIRYAEDGQSIQAYTFIS